MHAIPLEKLDKIDTARVKWALAFTNSSAEVDRIISPGVR